ncbi:hypothetical protein Anapl_06128 [Anas platyrhynchos]|uniref:Uncharacterized protein n=1 Tax=Anas platyrhynchos TaxID=8839 RepID=R0LA99_ANAPL|nr:hypothetical protein Anapl_06128 [Anas platyrhynchos]
MVGWGCRRSREALRGPVVLHYGERAAEGKGHRAVQGRLLPELLEGCARRLSAPRDGAPGPCRGDLSWWRCRSSSWRRASSSRRHRVESRFVCMMQECERVLQEMLVALCLCVFLGGESTDKYSLGCLELFIFPAADCVSVSVDSEEKSRYENRVNTCQQHHALVNERMFVSSQSSIFVQHASVAKYVRVGST